MKIDFSFKVVFAVLINFVICTDSYSTTGTAVANGNWGTPGTWSFGRVPNNNDTIIVPFGKTVTININSPVYTHMILKVNGTLFFNNGQKLNFDCTSIVVVYSSGLLDGGNPGSKIDMCGTTVWRGPGPDSGPLTYGFNPLPINLVSYSVDNCAANVCINWTTQTEANNDYFTIDKTKNDVNFELVANLKGAGNSTVVKHYSLIDNSPYDGVSYYRLKQTDFNGNFTFYTLREVDRSLNTDFSISLFPNPGNVGDVNLALKSERGKEVLVVVYDVTGRETYSKILITERDGQNVFALDPSGKLESGIYFVTGTSDRSVDSKKLVIR